MGGERVAALRRKPDRALVHTLTGLIKRVVDGLDEGQDCEALIAEINALAGGARYSATDFFQLYSWANEKDVAAIAARGVPDIGKPFGSPEVVEMVEIALAMTDAGESEFFLNLLGRLYPSAEVSDLIYYPYREELTAQDIADEILVRAALFKSGGPAAVQGRLVGQAKAVLADPDATPWARQWAGDMDTLE